MNVVLDQLLAISGRLQVPAGVPDDALASLREFLAASLIQQNPGSLPIEPDPTVDGTVNEAAGKGAVLATKFAATATRIRFLKDSYLNPGPTADRPTRTFGPFVDVDGRLVQFAIFESSNFLTVQLTLPAPFPLVTEALMLLPADSFSNDGNRSFSIPAGTIWLRARFVVRNTSGYLGLRVKQATLKLDRAAQPRPGRNIGVPVNARWTLTIEPEQPSEPDDKGSDANSVIVQIPESLEVLSTGESRVNGSLTMRGFGTDLEFATASGAPFADADSITFPYSTGDAPWSIDGNLSIAAQFNGESHVVSAGWTLPINRLPLNTFGEAAHGGSLRFKLRAGIESRMAAAAGTFTWFETTVNANATGFSLESQAGVSSARTELDLWSPAHTEATFNQQTIRRLLFLSFRDGRDVTLVSGGEIRNQWDLPLSAAGKPFSYKGQVELFAVIAEATGLLRVACSATQQPEVNSHGVALENLYLVVRAPRQLNFNGEFDGVAGVTAGFAALFFDVILAQPSLPDPYVANWTLPDQPFVAESALSISLRWSNSQTPEIKAQLERVVGFPEPFDALADEAPELASRFHGLLDAQPESLCLLDLSSKDHHLGVALQSLAAQRVDLEQNRLTVQLRNVRLLMQPQVQWEPIEVVPNPDAGARFSEIVFSKSNGARTLAGAASIKLVPVLPETVCSRIVTAAREGSRLAALFSLPFGLRALAFIDPVVQLLDDLAVRASLHQPRFADLVSARQLRLTATGALNPDPRKDPAARAMTGALVQLDNLEPGANKLSNVLSGGIDKNGVVLKGIDDFLNEFKEYLPLHHADLSGYGLSTFSDWHRDVPTGVTKVRFDVMSGRTSYEVIQVKTILAFPLCYVVRTVIMERRNSGKVLRFDSGWQPVNDGEFRVVFQDAPFDPARNFEFEKGVVKAFRNIRRIRVLSDASVDLPDSSWQPVMFDADAQLENVVGGGSGGGLVPIFDHPGYIQLTPTGAGSEVTRARIEALLKRLGKPIGGAIDCKLRVGGTLEMQLSGIFADDAPDDGGLNPALMLAAYGLPKMPRAGQWNAARINSATSEASPVDPRHGVPIIRRTGQPTYIFREPGDAKRSAPDEFGFLMSTPTSRVLFPKPAINPSQPGVLTTDKAHVADPYSLVQSTSDFPRPTYALRCNETPRFNISGDDQWRLTNPNFTFNVPAPELAKGGEWAITRGFDPATSVNVLLDSAIANKPWEISATPNDLDINIDGIGKVFTIHTNYSALSGGAPKLDKPDLLFGPALDAVKDVVSALSNFTGLANFHVDVDVKAGSGPSPSFIVIISLNFGIGKPTERIDIGVGKFYGEFIIRGELEAGLSGKTHGLLSAEFRGDVQQGIIPPVLFAGGFFRFAIQIDETGKPTIELGLATVASIGGDLIKNLIEVEVTVKYGYTLIPQTLEPGVLLGLEARAKLLGGLVGFSFAVEAMARIKRVAPKANEVIVWAQIRVCATVQVAWLVEDDIDVKTQFEQKIPLSFIAAAAFFPALAPAAALL